MLGAVVAHPRIAEVRGHDTGCVIGRTVVDDDHFQVAKCLRQRRFESGAQVACIIVRGDYHADGRGHRFAFSREQKGFFTLEIQKRYLPDGSGGMRSRYSHSYWTSGPKRSRARRRISSKLAGPKPVPRTMRKRKRWGASCTI